MCNKRNSIRSIINGRTVRIDNCIAELIFSLNQKGFKTVLSCCGHDKYPMSILYRERDDIIDLCSGRLLWSWRQGNPTNRKFYKKDKQGYYYLKASKGESD